ncbi:MAG: hypothetical protein AB1666_12765, partial [Pseudomonadota bacterium]
RSNPADASAAAAKVICFIVILASCIDTSNACHYDAVDLISVSLAGSPPAASAVNPKGNP